jgi:hypothetical protein
MTVNLKQSLENKDVRTLKYLWPMLCNKQQYCLPQTIEDYKNLFYTTKIKFDGTEYYFTDALNKSFRKFINVIYYHSTIAEYFSYDTVYKSVLAELERTINSGDTTSSIEFHLAMISHSLNDKIAKREFYFLLDGLTLKETEQLILGDVVIFNFKESHLITIIDNRIPGSEDEDSEKLIFEFVKTNFFGETCIKVSCVGDDDKAEQKARATARLVLNYFRFLFCIFHYERIYQNLIKISMKSESFGQRDLFFYQSEPKGSICISAGIGRKNLQNFELDEQFFKEYKEQIFLNNFFDFAFKENKTEIEQLITTAIYWIGEAQADFDRESSFLKYWIALESIFTSNNEEITRSICKGVSIVLAFGPYRFIDINTIKETYEQVSRLYRIRSKIVHRGSYQEIKETELIEICKLSWQIVLSFFYLRRMNYTLIKEVEEQTNRLFEKL